MSSDGDTPEYTIENIKEKIDESWEDIVNLIIQENIPKKKLSTSGKSETLEESSTTEKEEITENDFINLTSLASWLKIYRDKQRAGFKVEIAHIFTEKINTLISNDKIFSKIHNYLSFNDLFNAFNDVESFQLELQLIRSLYESLCSFQISPHWFMEDGLIEIHKRIKNNLELKHDLEKLILQIIRMKKRPFQDIII